MASASFVSSAWRRCWKSFIARRLEAVRLLDALLLLPHGLAEALGHLVEGVVEIPLLGELTGLLAQLADELVGAHHAEVLPRQLEAVAAHPLERLLGGEAFHQEVRESVEGLLAVEGEGGETAVPATVDVALHARP